MLAHHGCSLGYAIQEPLHVNVWRNRLDERGLAPGAWLQPLKRAVASGAGDDAPIALADGSRRPLGELRDLVSVEPGQKLAYVTDVADTPGNRAAIAELARDADRLFIESSFSAADPAIAADRAHLTTTAVGEIARAARVRRVDPFHFSPRYDGEEERMLAEVNAAFEGGG
jgi:ribonuclease Z